MSFKSINLTKYKLQWQFDRDNILGITTNNKNKNVHDKNITIRNVNHTVEQLKMEKQCNQRNSFRCCPE